MATTEQLTTEQAQQLWNQLDNEDKPQAGDDEPTSQPAPGAAPAAPTDQGSEEQDDPYAGMTAYQKSRLIGLEQQNAQLAARVRNVEGHIGGLKSQLSARQAPAAAAGAEAPTAAELQRAQASPEAMQRLKADYPEFAEAIESVVSASTAQLREELGRQQPAAPGLSQQDVHEAIVEFAHPSWKHTVSQPEFVGWLHQQPADIQRLAASDLAADAVKLLDTYKTPSAAATQRNKRLESQAGIPSGRTGSSSKGKSVDDMNEQEYWAYLDKQDAVKR